MSGSADDTPAYAVVGEADGPDVVAIALVGSAGDTLREITAASDGLAAAVAGIEEGSPRVRWVWGDTARWYPALLAAGVRVGRAWDLRMCHALLAPGGAERWPDDLGWAAASTPSDDVVRPALFELAGPARRPAVPVGVGAARAEWGRQREALADRADGPRMTLLCAAESVGALAAAEMQAAGLPWDVAAHERILTDVLGPRPLAGGVPARMAALADRVRAALGDPRLNPDSPARLLRALHRAGIPAASTSRWDLAGLDHPALGPLREYKKLSRLYAANGWAWLDEWVQDGRFHPRYVPSGVVTGRWAASGGGALQIPRLLRQAVRADEGWVLVGADVAQLEPRVLAAMSADTALAAAARGTDLYEGIVRSGVAPTRAEAKVAMLGAMYGATSGNAGRLMPRLRHRYPRAMALVDGAARTGEQGGVVSTWLGRTCPAPSAAWTRVQEEARDAGDAARNTARRAAGDRGRFTRNFVVQGTAAEWASVWIGQVRARLAALDPVDDDRRAAASGPVFDRRAHLVFFLHDELIVHAPRRDAARVEHIVRDAAAAATRTLFGDFPLEFPLDVHVAATAAKA